VGCGEAASRCFEAIRRASTVKEVTSHTGNSHTDNRCCNIDTETPTHKYEHNLNSRNDKSPVSHGLGGGGPTAFSRTMPVAQTELLYSGALHSQAT
jgi:ethanolamine utilization protein EutQ (cupin superfamily)